MIRAGGRRNRDRGPWAAGSERREVVVAVLTSVVVAAVLTAVGLAIGEALR